jgi:hypothetical protein
MVDTTNPTSQFHPYQPQDAVPHTQEPKENALTGLMKKIGVDSEQLRSMGDTLKGSLSNAGGSVKGGLSNLDVKGSTTKARDWARSNPALVLGGLATAVIGLGMARKRSMRPA